MKIEDCKPGVAVRYTPIIGGGESYPGIVRELPWQLGDGTWVTHLHNVEGYTRTTCYAVDVARALAVRGTDTDPKEPKP